jgi:3-oxoacyl-[acyl-carrier-protein] synthase III
MKYAHIVGWGKSVPKRVMTNNDLRAFVDTSDEWIRDRTGIGARRVAGEGETTSTLSIDAAMAALDVAGVSPAQLDLIIVATATPDYAFPSTACIVQDALGADRAGAYDLSAACSGFVYALNTAADAIKAGSANIVLVVGAETLSRVVNWKDRNTCVLFGDGAGAVVLQGSDQPGGVLASILRSDGSGGELLMIRAGGSAQPITAEAIARNEHTIQMNGREVFKFATRVVDRTVREVMNKAGWTPEQVDLFVPHQANMRIIESAVKSLGIPMEKVFTNLEHYGNTSAASIPIAIAEAAEKGRLRPNDRVVMVGFGAGLTWAAAAVTWGQPKLVSRQQRTMQRLRYGVAGIRSRVVRGVRRAEDRLFGTVDPTLKPAVKDKPAATSNGASAPEKERETL